MPGRREPRLTYANVVSTFALFVVLGGGAYAASVLPRHSVGPKQLKRGAVTRRKLGTGAVTSRAVHNHALRRPDFAAGALVAGPRGATGSRGATGITGATGRTGVAGSPAASMLLGNSTSAVMAASVLAPSGPSAPGPQIFDNNQLSPPTTIVARDLAVAVDKAPGGTTAWTFKLLADDVNTGVQCTIAGTETECTSGTATGTIDPGRELVVQVLPTGLPVPATVSFGWRATTP